MAGKHSVFEAKEIDFTLGFNFSVADGFFETGFENLGFAGFGEHVEGQIRGEPAKVLTVEIVVSLSIQFSRF